MTEMVGSVREEETFPLFSIEVFMERLRVVGSQKIEKSVDQDLRPFHESTVSLLTVIEKVS